MLKDIMLQLKELKEAEVKRDVTFSEVNAELSKLDEVLKISKANEENTTESGGNSTAVGEGLGWAGPKN
ncbi:hypothetical protein HPB48_013558 [Haemaphysalis longicornis]|uniref:Uncharacterized protein n=1 Tax=Haemaphysalis longicornis TaxID=44386 RepID=A0A9J6G9M0_HAELO|nr:hypothetical protein HPB48_013558 [Haemaphysalis longicornis]